MMYNVLVVLMLYSVVATVFGVPYIFWLRGEVRQYEETSSSYHQQVLRIEDALSALEEATGKRVLPADKYKVEDIPESEVK